ncbi:MAG: class F sortase [Anaerolineales bacterium]|nr:class F sortase [Anaerolineales bacterium]
MAVARRLVPLLMVLALAAFSLPSDTLAAPQRALVTITVDDWSSTANSAWNSMVLNDEGNPVIAYRYAPSSNLILAYCHNPLCSSASFRTLDSLSTVDAHISLKLSSAGNPVIAYYDDAGASRLRLALCDDPTCTTSTLKTLDTGVSGSYWVGRELSMALDSNDIPVISYAHSAGGAGLRVARCADAACSSTTITTVSGTPVSPRETSLALDSSGNPMIAYHQNNGGLFFVHCDDPVCAGSETLVTLYSPSFPLWAGRRLAMALDSSGNPVISYSTRDSNSYQHIELIRCNNANCSSLSRQAVTTPGVTDYIRSMSLVLNPSDNPVIAFANAFDPPPSGGTGSLSLAVCSTPTCTSTVDITVLDSSVGFVSVGASLQLDCEDNPVVSYHDDAGDALKLAANSSSGCRPIYDSAPLPGSTIAFSGAAGSSQQADIDVSNTGPLGKLDVSFASISANYSIVSGLDIDDLSPSDPAASITVQCDSVPQPAGTLVLDTNDLAQPTVTYDLTCEVASSGGSGSSSSGSAGGGLATSAPIAPSGVTTLQLGRLLVSLPANAIPPGQTGCEITVAEVGSSAAYGFTLDDAVFDVKVHCDSGELNIFFAPLTICIQPTDGTTSNKLVYHSHNGGSFQAMNSEVTQPGYVCGQTRVLSLFTLGQLALPNTGFAPGAVTALAEQPAELAYAATELSLSIPKLGVELDIVGVPQSPNGWDVSWLQAGQAGYLYGTSFPTWQGNSVLTAHVWNADNTAGPFHQLSALRYGDRFTVTAHGHTYTYEVRSSQLVQPESMNPLRDSQYSLITLVTCEGYDPITGDYLYRRAVQAVLVAVK